MGDGDRAQRALGLAHRVARQGQLAAELEQQAAHLGAVRAGIGVRAPPRVNGARHCGPCPNGEV
jgi:hypothetical protein